MYHIIPLFTKIYDSSDISLKNKDTVQQFTKLYKALQYLYQSLQYFLQTLHIFIQLAKIFTKVYKFYKINVFFYKSLQKFTNKFKTLEYCTQIHKHVQTVYKNIQ